MPVLIVILSILAFITLVLLIPIIAEASYEEQEQLVVVRYLFYKKQLFPPVPKKNKKEKPPGKRKLSKIKAEEKRPKKGFFETLHDAVEMVKAASGGVRYIIRRLLFYNIRLQVDVGGEDAAQTAIQYGKVSAFIYTSYAVLSNAVRFKKLDINIVPCYDTTETRVSFRGRMRVRPSTILAGGIGILFQFLVNTLNNQNNVRSGDYHGRSSITGTNGHDHAKNQGND